MSVESATCIAWGLTCVLAVQPAHWRHRLGALCGSYIGRLTTSVFDQLVSRVQKLYRTAGCAAIMTVTV